MAIPPFTALTVLALAILQPASQDAMPEVPPYPPAPACPAEFHHAVAFSSDEASDTLVVRAGGADCSEISVTISNSDDRQLLHFRPETVCSMDAPAYHAFAQSTYAANREVYGDASSLPVGEDMPPLRYMYVEDYDTYHRAVETGGPLVCFRSYDYGGVCAWYDPQAQAGVILFERGS